MRRTLFAAAICLSAASLVSCTGMPPVDPCEHAEVRRQIYVTTIAAADAYAASGRPVPSAVTLGREAAATALAVVNANCPTAG